MFDIGWSEMMVIAVLVLLIMGPKELPTALRTVTQWVRKAKDLTREFQSGVDEVIREADLQDARKALEGASSSSVRESVEKVIDPNQMLAKTQEDIKKGVESIDTIGVRANERIEPANIEPDNTSENAASESAAVAPKPETEVAAEPQAAGNKSETPAPSGGEEVATRKSS